MELTFLKCKIHRAVVTDANLDYEGSISIDPILLEAANIAPFEQVDVYNIANGERFTTYAIPGKPGEICINGAAAWKAARGNKVIIACYCRLTEEETRRHKTRLVFVNEQNQIHHTDGIPH